MNPGCVRLTFVSYNCGGALHVGIGDGVRRGHPGPTWHDPMGAATFLKTNGGAGFRGKMSVAGSAHVAVIDEQNAVQAVVDIKACPAVGLCTLTQVDP
jgi:hypothetical protein